MHVTQKGLVTQETQPDYDLSGSVVRTTDGQLRIDVSSAASASPSGAFSRAVMCADAVNASTTTIQWGPDGSYYSVVRDDSGIPENVNYDSGQDLGDLFGPWTGIVGSPLGSVPLGPLIDDFPRPWTVSAGTLEGRAVWKAERAVTVSQKPGQSGAPGFLVQSPNRVRYAVDAATGVVLQLDLDWGVRVQSVVRRVRFSSAAPAIDFTPPQPAGTKRYVTSHGYRVVTLADASRLLGYAPLVPRWVPSGYRLVQVRARRAEPGVKTGTASDGPGVTLVYRRGFDCLAVAMRPLATAGEDWQLRGGPYAQLGMRAEKTTLTQGALRGHTATTYVIGDRVPAPFEQGVPPSGWSTYGRYGVLVLGDVTRKQVAAVLESLAPANGGWRALPGAWGPTAAPIAARTPAPTLAPAGWSVRKLGAGRLPGLSFLNASEGWVCGNGTLSPAANKDGVWHTQDGGLTWQRVSSRQFDDLWFVDAQTGWALADRAKATLWRTSDGGATWSQQSLPEPVPEHVSKVRFMDGRHGAIAAGQYGQNHGGFVILTADGGATWTSRRLTEAPLQSVFFVDAQEGWAVGDQDVLHTADGGRTWQVQLHAGNGALAMRDVWFSDRLHGCALSWSPGRLWRTADGGRTWQVTWKDGSAVELGALTFLSARLGVAVGIDYGRESSALTAGLILVTRDGGTTWSRMYLGGVSSLSRVVAAGPKTVVASGGGVVVTGHLGE